MLLVEIFVECRSGLKGTFVRKEAGGNILPNKLKFCPDEQKLEVIHPFDFFFISRGRN